MEKFVILDLEVRLKFENYTIEKKSKVIINQNDIQDCVNDIQSDIENSLSIYEYKDLNKLSEKKESKI